MIAKKAMTQKQRYKIARYWAAAILANAGIDSFEPDMCSNEDAGEIIRMVHALGCGISPIGADYNSLKDIINKINGSKKEPRKETTKEIGERIRKRCKNSGNAGYGHGPFETSL
jgi:hypothetical protein